MTDFASGSASIADLYSRIGYFKGSPTRIAKATLDFMDEVMNNQVDIVDPTNPFIMLVECMAVDSADAVNESLLNLRRSYVGLAQTDEDIYRHMTDAEYIGRFAIPGYVDYTFMIDYDSLLKAMVQDTTENCLKGILPRDSYITVDTYTFTFEYPIVIRQFPNNVLQITYDTSISSPISSPANNIIPFVIRQDSTRRRWLSFKVPIRNMVIASSQFPIQRQAIFNKDIAFTDEFLYARVFQKSSATNADWSEIVTTHSDQVFDQGTPTAVLQVTTGNLNVTIPFIYNTLGLVTGTIRIDLYTTKGNITVNLASYTLDKFAIQLRVLDTIRDTNAFMQIWGTVTYVAFSDQILSGGADGVDFNTLKEKVIDYAFGDFQVPITNAQLNTVGELNGFTIVPNADTLTDRYFFAIRSIPDITVTDTTTNSQKLLTRANVGMIRFSSEISDLQVSDNVINNNNRFTLLSNTMFLVDNGISTLVENSAILAIKAQPVSQLVSTVNAAKYVYTPYYYVFDLESSFLNVRPYDLDHPDAVNLNFILQNQSLGLAVNTGQYAIQKIPTGYRVTITTSSISSYKQLNDNQVGVQMRFINEDGSLSGTINGVQQGVDPTSLERIYTFDIQTTYDINENQFIQVINAYNSDGVIQNFYVALDSTVDILYTTNSVTSNFVSDATDILINKNQLPVGSVGNSHDQINLLFGVYLEHLWARIRTYATGGDYQTSPVDVPMLYTQDVYQTNPVTGSMLYIDSNNNASYTKIHSVGDPVLNSAGQPVYKYRAGDTILDNNGDPIIITSVGSKNDFDIIVIDGNLGFATDSNYVTYRDTVSTTITGWITEDILNIQARLIERTNAFFYPLATLGVTQITINGTQNVYIESEQSLTVDVFLDKSVVNDTNVQNTIIDTISTYLDTAISQVQFTINQLESQLATTLGNNVKGITISGLGGDIDYKSINVTDQHNRLCIQRRLVANSDNTITIQPNLNILFTGL